MEVWTSLIAVFGTLAGAIASSFAARRAADRQDRAARQERTRSERLTAYLALAEALTALRRTTAQDYPQARATAEHALLRVRLLTPDDPDLIAAAQAALHTTTEIEQTTDPRRRTELTAVATDAADAFVSTAAGLLDR